MSGLVEFLRARYTEARERETSTWTVRRHLPFEWTCVYEWNEEYYEVGDLKQRVSVEDFRKAYGEPAADPGVLADLDAKLAVLDLHARLDDLPFCVSCDAPSGIPGRPDGCDTVRVLAVPFASHPDYREEWKP